MDPDLHAQLSEKTSAPSSARNAASTPTLATAMRGQTPCGRCHGTGVYDADCPGCGGIPEHPPCPQCRGSGTCPVVCWHCEGSGTLTVTATATLAR